MKYSKKIKTFKTHSGTDWKAFSGPRRYIPKLFIVMSGRDVESKIKWIQNNEFEKREWSYLRSAETLRIKIKKDASKIGFELSESIVINIQRI